MEELAGFAAAHPEFCDPKAVRVPGHGTMPSLEGGRPFELTADALSAYRAEVPKDPATLPAMLKLGPEAVAFYASFRLAPDRWGIYVREAAAESELAAGAAKYAPYQAAWYNPPPKPIMNPEDIGNIEEALANLEAFRQYINPTYADGVSRLVEGRLDERNVNEWKAFFIGGRFAVEMANVLSRQPPGWKDFGKFLNRKTSVGATNYVRIQYSYNPEMLERGQKELSRRIAGGAEDGTNFFKGPDPEFPPVYLM